MLALYGHPFSSYTWKALIPLYANGTGFEFRQVGPDHPDHSAFVARAHPAGKFPVLVDGGRTILEASCIVEYLNLHHPGPVSLVPADPDAALQVREELKALMGSFPFAACVPFAGPAPLATAPARPARSPSSPSCPSSRPASP